MVAQRFASTPSTRGVRALVLTVVGLAAGLAGLAGLAAPLAEFAPPVAWTFSGGNRLAVTPKADGGPAGGAWTEVGWQPGAAADFAAAAPLALPPGTQLRVWVKGNGSEDVLYLYLFGGAGHRAYNLPLNRRDWREVVFDISEDFGENHWRWDEPVRLDLAAIRSFKLMVPPNAKPGGEPVGVGRIALEPPVRGTRPAVLLATCSPDFGDPAKTYRILPHLRAAGCEVRTACLYNVGSATYIGDDQLARFNAVILLDLPEADGGRYPKHFERVAEVLHEYVARGGGLLVTAIPSGWNNAMPTINEFLGPWGVRCLDEQVVDPETVVQSDAWFGRYPFCWTENVLAHPVTAGVKGVWYPGVAWRADGILTTVAFEPDAEWQVLVRGMASARSVRAHGGDWVTEPAGRIATAPPIFAVRQAGKGRVGLLPIYPAFLTGGCDHPSWNSMVWDGTAKGRTCGMKPLFLNTVKWLCEPSLQSGELGGYVEPKEKPDYRPLHERPVPLDWAKARFQEPAREDYLMLVGLASSLSGGQATPADLLAAAKTAGYQVAVFAESLEAMNRAAWETLTAACAAASSDTFLALPGLRYRDPQGNAYLLFGTFTWPDDEWYRKCVNADGRVIDTYTLYAKVSGWRHIVIHSLKSGANPVLHLRHYSCVSVFTYEEDRLVDDAYADYLLLQENCYYPIPLAVHLVSTTEGVARARTGMQARLWARSLVHARELLDSGKAGESYFWNPKPVYLSSGPRLVDWQELNMNSWRATAPGTDQWRFRLAVTADAPLAEVRIVDGARPWRRYVPNRPEFRLEHTGHHGKQQQFTVRARDTAGGELVSSHLKTHTMEHVFFMCADRQNSLGAGNWGYQPWPAQYSAAPDIDIYDAFPPHWDGGAAGFGSFCAATVQPGAGVDVGGESDIGLLATTKRTLMASRDCTITEQVGDGCFRHRDDWGDCKPTPDLLPRAFVSERVRQYHYRTACGATGFVLVDGKAVALRDVQVTAAPGDSGVCLYRLSDHGGKNGELAYFAYSTSDGRRLVRHTPEGLPYFACRDTTGLGDYFSTFPRRLGAPALFPLSPVQYALHGDPRLFGMTFGAAVPGGQVKAGDEWPYRFLFACFAPAAGELNAVPEQVRLAYGLAGRPGYACAVRQGTLVSQVYELRLRAGAQGAAVVELGKASLPGALPVVVEGLQANWTAVVAEGEAVRSIGVFEGAGYTVVDLREKGGTFFVGHPVVCGDPRLTLELLDWGQGRAAVEVHNPTDAAIRTWVGVSPAFAAAPAGRHPVEVPPGTSVRLELAATP